MSRITAERTNAMRERAEIDAKIAASKAGLAILEAQAAVLDRIMSPPPKPAAELAPRRKRTTVREHERGVATADPGPGLPIAGEPTL